MRSFHNFIPISQLLAKVLLNGDVENLDREIQRITYDKNNAVRDAEMNEFAKEGLKNLVDDIAKLVGAENAIVQYIKKSIGDRNFPNDYISGWSNEITVEFDFGRKSNGDLETV